MSWSELLTFLSTHPYGRATGALIVSVVLMFVARGVLGRVMPKLTAKTDTDLDDRVVAILQGPVTISLLLAGCWYAATTIELHGSARFVVRGVLATLAVMYWSTAANRASMIALEVVASLHARGSIVQPRTLPALKIASRAVVLGGATYFLLLAWQVDVTGWLASAGIVGIAVGFAAKDTLSNLFAGVFILADAPYKLGDYLVLETGERGRVTEIGMRSTRLLTRDDVEVIVPNAQMATVRIVNESGGPYEKSRVRCRVSVAYGSDLEVVRTVLMEASKAHEDIVLDDPNNNPRVRFRSFGDSGLDFELLLWIHKPEYRGRVLDAVNTAVYLGLNEAGVEIPYPKLDVYMRGSGGGLRLLYTDD